MGIAGLLPLLEKASKKTNIREFSGGTVAIDTYCWLHKGVFSCAEKLFMGQTTNAYVLYCTKYINMLLKYNIKPILVFDGRRLPAKEQTEIKRRESRQMNRRKAIELIQMGQVVEGKNLLKRAIDISHEIALELIKYCQSENIDCIVAPYEADAQLAYLNITGIADVVITEDSDLTLFGCKKIFFKMDFNGNGILIEQDKLHLAMDMQLEQFNMDKFRYICILSGCDYLASLPGIGLMKARKFITKNIDHNIHRALMRIGSILNMKSIVVTQEYRDSFILADITFKHQLVFCPLQRKQVRLNPPTTDITEDQLQYAGQEINADLALQIALGNCDPSTLKMLHNFDPDKIERKRKRNAEIRQTMAIHISIWSSKYELKTKNHVLSSKNVTQNSAFSAVTTRKELILQRDSSNNMVSPNFHNSPTRPYNSKLSKDHDLNESILDMYNYQDSKLIDNPKQSTEQSLYIENNISPELSRQRNPFVKQVSDLTTSPSVFSDRNCRKKGRNLMRIRQTIIDETVIVESKYFSKQNEKHSIPEVENNIEHLKSIKCNIISNMDTDIHDNKATREQLEMLSIKDPIKNANLMENSEVLKTDENKCLTNSCEDVFEKSYSSDKINEISLITYSTMTDNNCTLDNSLVSSNSNIKFIDLINNGNMNSPQENLSEWSNEKNQVSPNEELEHFKKQKSSSNLVSRVNLETKRTRRNKRSSLISNQQSLLSMYGFQKR